MDTINRASPSFKSNNLFLEKGKSAYGNPLVFGTTPLLSGYISKPNYAKLKESAVAGVSVIDPVA